MRAAGGFFLLGLGLVGGGLRPVVCLLYPSLVFCGAPRLSLCVF